jgi:putative ABC transport system permease protein
MTFDRWRHIVRLRWRSLWSGRAVDRELDEELRFHVETQVAENIARGMTPGEARTAALRAMGGVEQRKEYCRDERRVAFVENLARDLRFALRQLRRQPAFAATAIASLALGIGANTAIFQLLNALSLRELPVRAPHELVELRMIGDGHDGRHNGRNRQVSLPQYLEIAKRQEAFSSMFAFGDSRFNLSTAGEVRYVDGIWVSGTFFEVLGVQPLLGRLIAPSDDQAGCGASPAAVISYALWQSEFGGRADIIGQSLPLNGSRAHIVGVTPREFFGVEVGRQFGAAAPICASGFDRRDHWWLAAVGRLKPGWTRESAAAHLQHLISAVQQETMPAYRADLAREYLAMRIDLADASSGLSPLRRAYQQPLWILMSIAGLVLLIASVNLANLMLARATARHDEFAVRLALGGSRGRVLQQVLTESGLLAVAGAIAAVGVALAFSRSIPPLISTTVDRIHLDLTLDWRIFGFTAAVALTAAVIFGCAPALRSTRASLLRGAARGTAANDGLALRRALVAFQVAVTLVLVFGGLLFLRTFQNLSSIETGVNTRNLVMATIFFGERAYPDERRRAAYRELDERLAGLPGVERVADAYTTPLGGSLWDTDIESDSQVIGSSNGNRVGPGYFATLGTALLRGRDFDARDIPGAPAVAIVNQAFADTFFAGDAIGRHFSIPDDTGGPAPRFQVVGLVAPQKYGDARETNPRIFYTPSAQLVPSSATRRYVIRSSQPSAQTVAAVTSTVAGLDPGLAIRYVMLDDQIGEALLQERLMARLSALFGAIALLLAAIGLYGVVSYTVASRRAEIGVRVALGASRASVLGMILVDVGRMLAWGLAAGTVVALVLGRGVASLLFGLPPDDVGTLLLAIGVLTMAGLLAAIWPARRAAGVDPLSALRES